MTSTVPAKLPGEVAVQTVVEQLGEVPAIAPKVDGGGAGDKAGAGDGDRGAAENRAGARADGGDRRDRLIGELVGRRGRRGATGGGDGDVDVPAEPPGEVTTDRGGRVDS